MILAMRYIKHHVQAELSTSAQVAVQIELKLYPDGLPQLWMFLYNSSQVHSALAPLSPQLNASVTGAL